MKKAAKKAALGLTLALTISTAFACAPADRGATDETGFRGTGIQQDRGTHFGVRGGAVQPGVNVDGTRPGITGQVGLQDRGGLFGRPNVRDRGLFGAGVNRQGRILGPNQGRGMLGGQRQGIFGGQDGRGQGILGGAPGQTIMPPTGEGFVGTGMGTKTGFDTLDRGTTQNIRGGGMLFGGGGVGPRMQGARTELGGAGNARGFAGRSGLGFNNALGAGAYDQDRVDDIQRRVMGIEGVRDARVVFHDNAVIVGVLTEGTNQNNVTRQIRQQLQGTARGEHIHVTTDRGMFTRIGDIDDRLRGGQPIRNAANEIGALMNDLGRTMTSPFRGQGQTRR